MSEKELLLQACYSYVGKRIDSYKNEIETIKDSIENNKSSDDEDDSGTGKLMSDLEKNMQYLNDASNMKSVLNQIDPKKRTTTIGLGSCVQTSLRDFFVAVSAGELKIDGHIVYAISLNSPIGMALFGKQTGEKIQFNGNTITINSVK